MENINIELLVDEMNHELNLYDIDSEKVFKVPDSPSGTFANLGMINHSIFNRYDGSSSEKDDLYFNMPEFKPSQVLLNDIQYLPASEWLWAHNMGNESFRVYPAVVSNWDPVISTKVILLFIKKIVEVSRGKIIPIGITALERNGKMVANGVAVINSITTTNYMDITENKSVPLIRIGDVTCIGKYAYKYTQVYRLRQDVTDESIASIDRLTKLREFAKPIPLCKINSPLLTLPINVSKFVANVTLEQFKHSKLHIQELSTQTELASDDIECRYCIGRTDNDCTAPTLVCIKHKDSGNYDMIFATARANVDSYLSKGTVDILTNHILLADINRVNKDVADALWENLTPMKGDIINEN